MAALTAYFTNQVAKTIHTAVTTGNAVFSHWMVTAQTAGGALPFGCQIRDGRLWRLGAAVVTPEEADLFAAIDLPYIPPEDRSALDWFVRGRCQP